MHRKKDRVYTISKVIDQMQQRIFAAGSILAGLGVALGAFGALATFETGVRSQMYHGLGLLALAWAVGCWPERRLAQAAILLIGGTIVFSGSLYLLALTGVRWFGAVTPFGGVALIAGWAFAAWRVMVGGQPSAGRP